MDAISVYADGWMDALSVYADGWMDAMHRRGASDNIVDNFVDKYPFTLPA